MNEEFVDPVDRVPPHLRAEGMGLPRQRQDEETHAIGLDGEIVAVHRKSGHHEGRHILDTSVGAEEHNEIVVRVESGDLGHLVGKRVKIRIKP